MWNRACFSMVCVTALAAGCTGVLSETPTGGAGGQASGGEGGAGNSSTSSATGSTTSSTSSSGSAGAGGAPPACTSLADGVQVTQVTVSTPGASSKVVTAARGNGSVVAWAGADGNVHVQSLDANDMAVGADVATEGTGVFGAAATGDEVALLVSRTPDFMTFVRINSAGQKLASTDLVGGGDHATVGVEWFGEFARTGRLVAQPNGTFAAYHALHRRWPDNIGHQGDTLRILNADGSAAGGGWGWGCSHSMDERLAVGPAGLVPICISDCYPDKGIYFNHNASMITPDPGANCAGGYTTALGGLVAVADGFFLVYQDASGGNHLGHFDMGGTSKSDRALTEPGTSRLAQYEDGLLLGSGGTTLEKLDAAGQPTGEKANVAAPLSDQDFESRPGGEVAWASISGSMLTVVRVRTCP